MWYTRPRFESEMSFVLGEIKPDGNFTEYDFHTNMKQDDIVTFEQIKPAGVLREIPIKPRGNALEPTDADFDNAAVYRIKLPPVGLALTRDRMLRLHYVGDVARLYLDGKLLGDNFYNGTTFDLGLQRFGNAIYQGELVLKILP